METANRLKPLLVLNEVLEKRYADLADHGSRVARYSETTAEQLGLPNAVVDRLRLAGRLHDLGKVGVPSQVLEKPGALDKDEWAQVCKHPEIGANLLASSNQDEIAEYVLAHHERPDGRGYPHRRENAQIPVEAKVLAVADAYDAMVSHRVYRPALNPEAAGRELRAGAGTQFDGEVVEAFLRALDADRELVAA